MHDTVVELIGSDGESVRVQARDIIAQTCHECAGALVNADFTGLEFLLDDETYSAAEAWAERAGLLVHLGYADRWGEPCDMCRNEIDGDVHYFRCG